MKKAGAFTPAFPSFSSLNLIKQAGSHAGP